MSDFQYYNINPYRKHTGDCVIRAIACALDLSWDRASDLLYNVARGLGCEMSCIGCYSSLFSDLNLFEVNVQNLSVGEVARRYRDNIVIIRIPGHLTCAKYGKVLDIWDCTNETVDRAWIVK